MEVFVYRGEWGLPSIDYECSRLLAYLKFSGAKLVVNFNGNPFSSPNGMLPYMIADGKKIAGYGRIVEYLTAAGIGPPVSETDGDNHAPLVNGHMLYVQERLHPYFMYMLWGDPKNVDATRSVYAKLIPVPFNFYCPRKYVARTNDITQLIARFSLEDSIEFHDVSELAHNAKACLNLIAAKLEETRWFLGDRPTEVDAMLYGYLSVLLKLTLTNNVLQNHIRQCPKLVQFVDRTTSTYFAKEGFNSFTSPGNARADGQQKNSSSSSNDSSSASSSSTNGERSEKGNGEQNVYTGQQQDSDDGPKEQRKRYILSGLVASVAMMGYALLSGILTLPTERNWNFLHYDDAGDYDDDN